MAEELGVEMTETLKSDNHISELLLGAANVGLVGVGMGKQQYVQLPYGLHSSIIRNHHDEDSVTSTQFYGD
jgi:hypothetical protein